MTAKCKASGVKPTKPLREDLVGLALASELHLNGADPLPPGFMKTINKMTERNRKSLQKFSKTN